MSKRPVLAAITLAFVFGGLTAPARAGERKLFENVRGWEIERNLGLTGRETCQMSYSYRDKDDNNAENAIVLSLDEGKVNLVLGYANWTWDKDEAVKASFSIDKQVIFPKQGWTGEANLLWSQLPDSVLPKLVKGKQIVLKFDDGAADFAIPGFADAYDGLKRCNAAASPAPQASAAPAEKPNQIRLQAYFMGLILQKTAASCAVSTTAPQRAAVDAKVTALRTEFAAIDGAIQDEIKKLGGTPDCPKDASDAATFDTELKSYVDLGPEDYVAAADKRSTEREAAKKAAAEAQAKADLEAKMRAEIESKMRAEADAKSKAEAETKARAEMETRIRAEVEAKLKAEAEAKAAQKVEADAAPKP
ncbi:hypothetical protein [Methylobacterium sp. J-067]|uniref:hypothetical protein n=1 Tax=Methylobacterium sp. J-067 TaxID=2836648 RepID=UPI001FBA2C95|nr:hypothetical protein [Methylobacterium sp. J-067]MCJ2022975.1 hypothetical protein [Methylobacterium sp. J-067]